MKRIEIIISPTGGTTVQTTGFDGSECEQSSRFLIEALGETTNRKFTSEYFQTRTNQQIQIDHQE